MGHVEIQEMFRELAKELDKPLGDDCGTEGDDEVVLTNEWKQRRANLYGNRKKS